MAKIITTTFGAVLILVGLGGFASPTLFGAHCSPVHNLIHLVAGAVLVYAAQRGGPSALLWSALGIGVLFLAAGLAGILLGQPGTSSFVGMVPDLRLWVVVPGVLEFGRSDHMLNLFFGVALVIAAVVSVAEMPFRLRK